MIALRLAFIVAVGIVATGCATLTPRDIPAKLYSLQDGTVTPGVFFWQGKLSGPTRVTRGEEQCNGEFRTVLEGRSSSSESWGSVFRSVSTTSNSVEHAQRGSAIAACPSGAVYECEYITNVLRQAGAWTVTGYGACKDNRGGTYRLMF